MITSSSDKDNQIYQDKMQWSVIGGLGDINVLAALKMTSLKVHEKPNIFEV